MADVLCLQPVYFKPTIPGFWPSDNPRFIIAKKKKVVPSGTFGMITAFAGPCIRLRDYQTAKCLCRLGPHPLKKGKAVKEKTFNRLFSSFPKS